MKISKFVVGFIVSTMAISAHAAQMSNERKKELCLKSDTKIWAENTQTCVPLDACLQSNNKYEQYCATGLQGFVNLDFRESRCVSEFKELLNELVRNNYNAPNGCDEIKLYSDDNSYAGCSFNGDVVAFLIGPYDGRSCGQMFNQHLWCLAFGGAYERETNRQSQSGVYSETISETCKNITAQQCDKISGNYDAYSRTCTWKNMF